MVAATGTTGGGGGGGGEGTTDGAAETSVGAVVGCPLFACIVTVVVNGGGTVGVPVVVVVGVVVVSMGMEFNLASSTANKVSRSVMRPVK